MKLTNYVPILFITIDNRRHTRFVINKYVNFVQQSLFDANCTAGADLYWCYFQLLLEI